VLIEEYLPGREFTIGVLGTGTEAYVPGAMEIVYRNSENNIYSYENKENYEEIVDYIPVKDELLNKCKKIALDAWKALNCLDGGRVDAKIDKHGALSFIEVNPLAGLNPLTSDLPILCKLNGISYQEIINEILKSAIKRNFGHEKNNNPL
jgi:D-alanine-D-alanine ligase